MTRGSGGNSAGKVVAGLTVAAFAVVAFLAFQAAAKDVRPANERKSSASPSKDSADRKKREEALPARSGKGERVVYGLEKKRVWLVAKSGKVKRTYEVWPSTVSPEPGRYQVTSRAAHVTGSDGKAVENVVRFAIQDGTSIGFSAAVDGSKPELDPAEKTGGIREKRDDGQAMWLFAPINTKIVVVP
ncbi:hypothetical protein LHJ74_20725 [Streptomyces sp. N2-109]|uniref:L,D-transpeptidase n=1 Tax=Streptomyces gossypii TaxID=2883101 RepID=A0ABT2JWM0_9ACTN|nr:hypothetical protein [Streptomyces gossypii]MCT2592297.1 hypothetical protein [Streptomyces gossypii]